MNTEILGKPIDILLVEDNPGDARLALESLKESKIRNTIHWVQDGLEAMKFMHRQGSYANAPRADLILLDLNMPKMDGRKVLAEIKSDDDLKRIPVVIFTISKAEEDILKAYDLHTNCYITKPLDLDRFLKVIQSIEDFWLTIVRLPKE
jgi:two-component system, chemotaxis family, response regulator Rcp1